MPSFVHPVLLWGLLAAAAPVLIHLINMLRHRRVEWAAMEFLLFSQRKHRTWILLKQLLLLLLRIGVVAAAAIMVAQPVLRSQWGSLLGNVQTHHILLLDDSFSMSDHWGDASAFARAKAAIERVGAAAARQTQPQTATLLRFSQAARPGRAAQPDLIRKRVDAEFVSALAEKLKSIDVSQTAAEPAPALEALDRLLGEAGGERRIVYLISDFRARQWDEPTDLKQRLARLSAADVELRLVDCVNAARPNLAIVSLEPVEGIQAAGVPWLMGVRVRNFGATPAKDVPVLLVEDGRARSALRIAEIPPGRAVQERFPVFFPLAGQHRIAARLESDAVAADNFRFAVVDLPADVPVLLVDGDPAAGDAYYLSKALASGEAPTGIRPRIETPRFLADKPLDRFQAINVANVDRLDQSAIRALERCVAEGGGVAFFLGPRCDSRFINESLYRRGEGLFPLPLAGEAELPVDRLEKAPDVEADASHFVFRVFAETRNSFLNSVTVERYFACKAGWKPPTGSTVRVLARLRNGAPLVVEQSFGKGRVVAMLSTAAPQWNNWARNPSFVVAMLDLQAHLAGRASSPQRLVGQPLEINFSAADYQPQVHFITPDADAPPTTVDAVRARGGQWLATLLQTDCSGFYEAQLARSNGKVEIRREAVNVDAAEGDLRALFGPELASRLQPEVKYQFDQAETFELALDQRAGYNLGDAVLYALLALLIGEQLLAYSAGYHPAAREKAAAWSERQLQGGGP